MPWGWYSFAYFIDKVIESYKSVCIYLLTVAPIQCEELVFVPPSLLILVTYIIAHSTYGKLTAAVLKKQAITRMH